VPAVNLVAVVTCPTCQASLTIKRPLGPGSSFLVITPCPACRTYASYLVTDDGAAHPLVPAQPAPESDESRADTLGGAAGK